MGLTWDNANQDRDKFDGAILRSDHWSFQNHGFPAVVVSEDFFANDPTKGDPIKTDANPNYHQAVDRHTEIDPIFAADVASAISHTVKKLADM
ncbi:MAG TPA: M28 family peptidase [Nitrososphaeraceae archaeon]|nr:M28 family peptidase [Nitrososphaeraceae archaeon]